MKGKHRYEDAIQAALKLEARLKPFCERIVIAGSLRRRCATVGDIEMVAIPKMRFSGGLFGMEGEGYSLLDLHLNTFPEIYEPGRWGERMKQLRFDGYPVDLFICTPERWGVILTIRTGSADFSRWLVTSRLKGGGRMSNRRVEDGRVWKLGVEAGATTIRRTPMETPQEEDVFKALGVPWIPLGERQRGYWGEPVPELEKRFCAVTGLEMTHR